MGELQRRSGDGFVFQKLVQNLFAQIVDRHDPSVCVDRTAPFPLPSLDLPTDAVEHSLGPIIDMARCAGNHELQAEAASLLWTTVAEHVQLGAHLCAPEFRTALERFLSIDSFCVVYPAARVLSAITRNPRAVQLLLDEELPELTRLMIEKLVARTTDSAVKEHLATSLIGLVRHCGEWLVTELAVAFDNLFHCPSTGCTAQIHSCLQKASEALKDSSHSPK